MQHFTWAFCFHYRYAPEIGDFVYITDNAYTQSEIRTMEIKMMEVLKFDLGRPLPLHFLRRNSKAGQVSLIVKLKLRFFTTACHNSGPLQAIEHYVQAFATHKVFKCMLKCPLTQFSMILAVTTDQVHSIGTLLFKWLIGTLLFKWLIKISFQ